MRLRYFNPEKNRAGIAEDVVALGTLTISMKRWVNQPTYEWPAGARK